MISRFGKLLTKLRSSSPLAERVLRSLADVSAELFGEAGKDLTALQKKLMTKTEYLRIREELLATVPANLKEPVFTDSPPTLQSPRLLNWAEMQAPSLRKAADNLAMDPDDTDRKIWEKSAVLHMLRSHGFVGPDKKGLGIGIGTESLPFYLSRYCKHITGVDRYRSQTWETASMSAEDVYNSAPVPFDREKLAIMDSDMRYLDFHNEEFDFVWSISAVEHVATVEEYLQTYSEISRILKKSGIACITTEWNLVPQNPSYKRGLIVLDDALYMWLIANLKDLKPIEKLNTQQAMNINHVMATDFRDPGGRTTRPCINILSGGSFITPILLVFRKI